MFCPSCGREVSDQAVVCPSCGVSLSRKSNDASSFGFGLLGFCIPLVGLVLYLVWKDNKPLTAKSAGMGALISVIVSMLFYVLIGIGGALS